MQDPHNRPIGGVRCRRLLAGVYCGALTVVLSSCSADIPVLREAPLRGLTHPETAHSVVFVIHGDGDYRYHDVNGQEREADLEALAAARRVAVHNPGAEVFIFHQRPPRRLLYLFSLPESDFFYYRNGRLIVEESYRRNLGNTPLEPEVNLYRRSRAKISSVTMNIFLYFGHQIPEAGGPGYDASFPARPLTVRDLATGLKEFTSDSARFDLLILSTCFGGTPYTIGTIGAHARTIIASPENLHLSYFDLQALERLDLRAGNGEVSGLAKLFAHKAFDRLTRNVQTAVSVAVYDVDRVQDYVRTVSNATGISPSAQVMGPQAGTAVEHCDCAELPAFALQTMKRGVDVLYRPARFGRSQHKRDHSGWGCWKAGEPPDPVSSTAEQRQQ